jgi:hypothetical protein
LDLNFIRNLDHTEEQGYGAVRGSTEFDPFYAKIETIAQSNTTQGDLELNKLDKLAEE